MMRGTVGHVAPPPVTERLRALVRGHFAPGGPLELWGRAEVAEYLDVAPSNMPRGLPAPVFTRPKQRGSFWLATDIREFARARGQQEGRPA